MPRSKRDKKISLTKTSKKGLNLKQQLVENIRTDVEKFPNLFVLDAQNVRNSKLKEVRGYWKDSRFFFGKNKVMVMALGKSQDDEVKDNLHQLTSELKGQCGLLFTSKPKSEVLKWFKNFKERDYARSGFVATETVELNKGPLPDFSHSMEPHLRKLGLPTSLNRGVVTLIKDHTVCKVGDVLTPEQANILKLLGNKMAVFKLKIRCMWNNGKYEKLRKRKTNKEVLSDDVGEIGIRVTKKEKIKKKGEEMVTDDVEMAEVQ